MYIYIYIIYIYIYRAGGGKGAPRFSHAKKGAYPEFAKFITVFTTKHANNTHRPDPYSQRCPLLFCTQRESRHTAKSSREQKNKKKLKTHYIYPSNTFEKTQQTQESTFHHLWKIRLMLHRW